ncbi:MAG: hypothetical protein WKG07_34895 [Hymenobacter sp.]
MGTWDLAVGELATGHVCLNDGTGHFTTQDAPGSGGSVARGYAPGGLQ